MELFDYLGDLNWLAVVVAALSSFVVGFLWYDKNTFGRRWMKLVGLTEKQMSNPEGMAKSFSLTGLFSLLTAIVLGCLLLMTGTNGFSDSLVFGVVMGLVFRGGAHVIHNGFAKRDDMLTLIDAAHDVVAIAVMAVILGVWI